MKNLFGLTIYLLTLALVFHCVNGVYSEKSIETEDPARDDPSVFFFDDFEDEDFSNWDDGSWDQSSRLRIATEANKVFAGNRSLELTAQIGEQTGGNLKKWFMPGYEQVYARWYCKFADDFDQGNHMHFVHFVANRPDNKWSGFGKAGTRPDGTDFFTTGLEPWPDWGRVSPPGYWNFYSYFPDMKKSRDGHYWGNSFVGDEKIQIKRGRWYCVEMMVKANTPGENDGEQAFWIDGKLGGRFTDIRWRDVKNLKVTCFWLLLYVHASKRVNRVWFDNVAVSTRPIGPIPGRSEVKDASSYE